MSSFTRRLQRRAARAKADYEPKPQPVQMLKNGGYITIHPTKGYRRVSPGQIMAQRIISELKQAAGFKMMARARLGKTPSKNDSATYRGIGGCGPRRLAEMGA